MGKTIIKSGTPWLLILQITLLVLSYGHIVNDLPWWVIWAPCLFFVAIIGIVLVVALIVTIIAAIASFL